MGSAMLRSYSPAGVPLSSAAYTQRSNHGRRHEHSPHRLTPKVSVEQSKKGCMYCTRTKVYGKIAATLSCTLGAVTRTWVRVRMMSMRSSAGGTDAIFLKLYTTMITLSLSPRLLKASSLLRNPRSNPYYVTLILEVTAVPHAGESWASPLRKPFRFRPQMFQERGGYLSASENSKGAEKTSYVGFH